MRVKEGNKDTVALLECSEPAIKNYIIMNVIFFLLIKLGKSLFAFNTLIPDKCLRLTHNCSPLLSKSICGYMKYYPQPINSKAS